MGNLFTHSVIRGIAAALPKEKQKMEVFYENYGEKTVRRISKATGIEQIHVAPQGVTAADYCMEAAKNIFRKGICAPSDIDGVVFIRQTPDCQIPHTSASIQHKLDISTNALAMDLNFGCAGYVYGLFQAMLLVETGYCKNVLLCAGDTLSHLIHPMDKALRLVMGDGGTATIVSATNVTCNSAFSFFTDGSGSSFLQIPAGGSRLPSVNGKTDIVQADDAGNERTLENLYMDGSAIMAFALDRVPQVVRKVLSKIGWSEEDVNLFALHQANSFMVKYIAKTMKVDSTKVPINVKTTGNTSSASIPLMLCNLYSGHNSNLQKVLCCGFGTGLACAAAAVNLSEAIICNTVEL